MLFSEPKIPQSRVGESRSDPAPDGFSALQRAENSSIRSTHLFPHRKHQFVFQCSSASRKFLNPIAITLVVYRAEAVSVLFSEPKIPQSYCDLIDQHRQQCVSVLFSEPKIPQSSRTAALAQPAGAFQCSSASRKFLNRTPPHRQLPVRHVSVLFSEPKIPQSTRPTSIRRHK